jgi:hypothetical protein
MKYLHLIPAIIIFLIFYPIGFAIGFIYYILDLGFYWAREYIDNKFTKL